MKVKLTDISNDASIQCRASINMEVLNSYAERMTAGDIFPAVELFSDGVSYWIADGWHRVMAAKQIGANEIDADVKTGSRFDALKVALQANSVHGLRRTNEDKRRCVEIALAEFKGLSSRAYAEMCGVSDMFVGKIRPEQVQTVCTSLTPTVSATVKGLDGKNHPAHKPPRVAPAVTETAATTPASEPSRAVPRFTPTPIGAPIARPPWLPPENDGPREESACLKPAPQPEQKEVTRIRDPLDTTERISDKDIPKDEDSATLYHLKRFWRMATKKDKNAFERWINENNG